VLCGKAAKSTSSIKLFTFCLSFAASQFLQVPWQRNLALILLTDRAAPAVLSRNKFKCWQAI